MGFFDNIDVSDPQQVLMMLNQLYAGEIIAAEQYYRHAVDVTGIWSTQLQGVFEEHAEEEYGHASKLREHIMVLGGTIYNKMENLVRLQPTTGARDVQASRDTKQMLKQDEMGEDDAINAYTEAILKLKDTPYQATVLILQEILRDELHHRHELRNLLAP